MTMRKNHEWSWQGRFLPKFRSQDEVTTHIKQKTHTRRQALAMLSAAAAGAFTSCVPQFALAQDKQVLRIGYQKAASTLVLLKAHGTLEKRLAPQGIEVKWAEFAAGPQLLEALNVGSVDFGYVGEAPPIIAQAAGAD